jgi:beta-barrel assembly-enhancing protease
VEQDGYGGLLFRPGGGSGESCRVLPRGDSLEVRVAGEAVASVPYFGVRVSPTGVDDRYLCFERDGDEGALRVLIPDRRIAGELEAIGAPRSILDQLGAVGRTRSRRRLGRLGLLAAAGGVLAVVALLVWAAFGRAVDAAVEQIPPGWETEIGRVAAKDVLAEKRVCFDPKLRVAVGEIGRRLVAAMGATDYGWRVFVLDDEQVNAFALPGGYIFVNRGLIEAADDPHQLAGVLAHECQHVIERHGIHNMAREVGLMLIVYALAGDAGAVERFLVGNAAGLASMSFSRDQEREADAGGLEMMYRAGLDPSGLPRFLRELAEREGAAGYVPELLSTHPDTDERAERLTDRIRERGAPETEPLKSDWEAVRERCSPVEISDPDSF